MKAHFRRILAGFLCAVLLLAVLPANGAATTGGQTGTLTEQDGAYWFTTVEDLKTLAGMTFGHQTWAYYTGEDPLVISENLTLPENLIVHGYEKSVHIPQGVTVSLYALRMRNIVVDGTLNVTHDIIAFRNGSFTVNGKLIVTGSEGSVATQNREPIRGEENIVFESGNVDMTQCLYVTDTADFMAMLGLAYANPKPGYLYMLIVEGGQVDLTNDVTLQPNLMLSIWNGGRLTVGSGCTLTVQNTNLNVDGEMSVNGRLVNNGYVQVTGSLQLGGNADSYGGSGTIYGWADSIDGISDYITGLDMESCMVSHNPENGYFSIRWAEDMFTDVDKNAFYFDAVQWAVKRGITTGTAYATFSPDAACTRGQVVTFLWRAAGQPEPSSLYNPFGDVTEADYYYKAVLWAVEKGITNGLSATAFGPNEGCNRGQVATFLHRYANRPSHSGRNPFTDVNQQDYFYNPVLWAVESGITNGMGDGIFAPGATCTRGQIVTFLYRAIGK